MKLINIKNISEGKFLNLYHLIYLNKENKEKVYEMVTRDKIKDVSDIATKVSGITIVILHKTENKLLILKEFRMAANQNVYNFVAGLIDEGESIEECAKREIFEETGLENVTIKRILNPAFTSIGVSDEKTITVFAETDGEYHLIGDSHPNELIEPKFYSKEEIRELLKTESFTAKTQTVCHAFIGDLF